MPIDAQLKTVDKNGEMKEEFSVSFTNGALEQIRELQKFFKTPDEVSVVKMGISLLQKYREESPNNN
ncbi:MAG TPA: hypothetical protein VMC41_01145 [Candidatus Nanoarchaeia archaeon]|nr:hypothetical protein [Candidatus Nanoarchaeia archaeon]